jgi:hypothetical protein
MTKSKLLTTSRKPFARASGIRKFLRSKAALGCLSLSVVYCLFCNVQLQRRELNELLLDDHRSLVRELITQTFDNGDCDIGSPNEDANPAPDGATHTLLVSYPGSGKRFTWTLIKALTNSEVADDWDFSEKLNTNPLTIKTSFPHKEGTWSWGKQMDQVLLLVRSPRWAIPSYHNMRFELNYADGWLSSLARVDFTYTERPAVAQWYAWRNARFDWELSRWAYQIDFWMNGGFSEVLNATHPRCLNEEIECKPKAVIDFDNMYGEKPGADYFTIGQVLDASTNVEVITAQARACVLDKVFERSDLHQGRRPNPDLPAQYRFTAPMLSKMLNTTETLRDKYAAAPWDQDPIAQRLVEILSGYVPNIRTETLFEENIAAEAAAQQA